MDKLNEFIKKANEKHQNENLDYSESIYINSKTKIKIIDHDLDENGNEYGEYWMTPCNHLKGQSHPNKRKLKISVSKRSEQDDIIKRFNDVHKGENLDYSEVHYVNMHTKVKIISHDLDENGEEYGEFWQEPNVHLKGCTHPRIGAKKSGMASAYTTEKFIEKCKQLYDDRYGYQYVNYINSKTKVDIFCNKVIDGKPHGIFSVSPDLFLQGKGCPRCGHQLSKVENEIYDFLCESIGKVNVIQHDITVLSGKELDIYVPSKKFAIEYNGLRWHSEKFGKDRNYHVRKTNQCNNNGITLFQIYEDEFLYNKELVFDKIKSFLNLNTDLIKIGARKCIVSEISKSQAEVFLNKYHIQGYVASTIYLGTFYRNELVAVMTFKKDGKDCLKWELNRFATNILYTCQGVAGKLFSYFIKNYNPQYIKTFLDRRWSNVDKENLYDILGFKKEMILKPSYSYTLGHGKRIHKFLFRKNILHKKYGFPLTMTETEMAKELGYDRIWDCGLIKYMWKNQF